MTINQIIIDAIGDIVPVYPDWYGGDEKEYVTFLYSEIPVMNANNQPMFDRITTYIHLFAPLGKNVLALKAQIRKKLTMSGFTYPTTTNATNDDSQHFVMQCEYCRGMCEDG